MIIIIEDSSAELANLGDAAMLRVCVRRLQELFPDAKIFNLCRDPEVLPIVAPGCKAIPELDRDNLSYQKPFYGRLSRILPFNQKGDGVRNPKMVLRLLSLRGRISGAESSNHLQFLDLLSRADLIVAAGGGYLTDLFAADCRNRFITLETALSFKKAVVFFGQGLGPFSDEEFKKRTLNVLSRAKLVGLREAKKGPRYLEENGVAPPYLVTGDDAVELGWENRATTLGDRIGINCRMASYSGVDEKQFKKLTRIFTHLAGLTPGKQFLALPISHHHHENDAGVVSAMVGAEAVEPYPSPQKISFECFFANLKRCRLVVTGSYHAMIFALSAGIPAVGLVASEYYDDKFSGAVDQFGRGAATIDLRSPDFLSNFARITNALWEQAEALRPKLLLAAERQIDAGRDAYQRLPDLISEANRAVPEKSPLKAHTARY